MTWIEFWKQLHVHRLYGCIMLWCGYCGCFHEGSVQLVMVCRLKVQPTFDHVFSSPPSRLTALRSLVYEHSESSFNGSSFIAL